MVKYLLFAAALAPALCAAGKTYSRDEVARHKLPSDCWLVIDGRVYDVTGYIDRHNDFDYDISRHCGTDASALWRNKPGTGDSHSPKAERLLKKYGLGPLTK